MKLTITSSSNHHRSNSNPNLNSNSICEFKKEQDRKVLISKWQNGLIQSNSPSLRKTKSFNHQRSNTKDLFLNRTSTLTEFSSSSIDNLSSRSTLNTSINSIQPKPSTGYQPKPLLLSTFNHSNTNSLNPNFKRQISNLERKQLNRYQEEILNEFKLKKKQERLNELKQISLNLNPSFENPNDDQWDWLSSTSDLNESVSFKEEDDSIQVVWRASLDIGRKVSKNRKALGKSSVIKPFSNSQLNHSLKKPQSVLLDSNSLFKSIWFNSSFKNPSKVFIFSSGLFAGIFSSIFSTLIWRSSLIERSNLGFFINFLFPSDLSLPNNLIGWSTPTLIRLTGIGIYYHC